MRGMQQGIPRDLKFTRGKSAYLILELARCRPRPGEQRCAIAMLIPIDNADGLVQSLSLQALAAFSDLTLCSV